MRADVQSQVDARPCAMCGKSTTEALPGGLEGAHGYTHLDVCSPQCQTAARRLAGRYIANREPALAGHAVAWLGFVTGLLFKMFERELGGLLIVVSLLALGTIRLAYPEVVPVWLVRRYGAALVVEVFQWFGVLACLSAVAFAVTTLLT